MLTTVEATAPAEDTSHAATCFAALTVAPTPALTSAGRRIAVMTPATAVIGVLESLSHLPKLWMPGIRVSVRNDPTLSSDGRRVPPTKPTRADMMGRRPVPMRALTLANSAAVILCLFASWSDVFANKQRITAAEFANVKARIGTGLLPIM